MLSTPLTSVLALSSLAATAAAAQARPAGMPDVPTTRVLAIAHVAPGATLQQIQPVMKQEVQDTVRLYLAGKIDQWYVRRDQNGVVFVLNATSVQEAEAMLAKLPLDERKLLIFDLIPLGPLSPLALLMQPAGEAPTPAR